MAKLLRLGRHGLASLLSSSRGQALLNTIAREQDYMYHRPLLVPEGVAQVQNLISE